MSTRRWARVGYTALNFTAVGLIVVLDWLAPAGVVVGILLCLPIMLAAATSKPREVWVTFGLATAGFLVAAVHGRGPISPAAVWMPNRIFVLLTLPATCAIALWMQSRRAQLERLREDEARSSDLNRILVSLLAHDLRSPLVMAIQAFDYVNQTMAAGQPPSEELLAAVETRLERSLASLEGILSLARHDMAQPASCRVDAARTGVELATELVTELRTFDAEAAARGKVLELDLMGDGARYAANLLLLRQAAAILVDNAIRHARPGPVRVSGRVAESEVRLTVEDSGPLAQADASPAGAEGGAGIGLELCRALLRRAGGTLELARRDESGTAFAIHLPLRAT